MEVRVVEEGPVQVNPHSQESPDVIVTTVDGPIKSPEPATVPQEPLEPTVPVQLHPASSADNTQRDHAGPRAGGGTEGGEVGRSSTSQPEPVLDQPTGAGTSKTLNFFKPSIEYHV